MFFVFIAKTLLQNSCYFAAKQNPTALKFWVYQLCRG